MVTDQDTECGASPYQASVRSISPNSYQSIGSERGGKSQEGLVTRCVSGFSQYVLQYIFVHVCAPYGEQIRYHTNHGEV